MVTFCINGFAKSKTCFTLKGAMAYLATHKVTSYKEGPSKLKNHNFLSFHAVFLMFGGYISRTYKQSGEHKDIVSNCPHDEHTEFD